MASVHAYEVYGPGPCGCGIAKTTSRPGKLVFIDATNQVTRALLVATKSPSALLVASPENPIHFLTTHLNDCGKEQSVNPVARKDALSSFLQRSRLTKCLCMGLYRTGAHNRGRIVPPWPSAPWGGWVPCGCSVQEDVASVVPIQWWRPGTPWAVSSLQSIWKAKADDLWWQQGRAATSSRRKCRH